MWLPVVIIFLSLYLGIISSFELIPEKEAAELVDLFIENLKADPVLIGDHEVSKKSKTYISDKMEKFVHLVSQSQNAKFSRTKRSLDDNNTNEAKRYLINVFPKNVIPTQYAQDVRLFRQGSNWFAVSLEDKTAFVIYHYLNGTFHQILHERVEYTTNVAVLSIDNLSLMVVGEVGQFRLFQFNFKARNVKLIQTIKAEEPKHVVLWEQNQVPYLSTIENQQLNSGTTQINVYHWLGKHFDHVQSIPLFNIKKTVPFSIHGSYYLTAVKHEKHEDEGKTYSEIFKFNMDSMKFEPYQPLLTNGCTDIKYFTSELDGESHHFLIVIHSAENGSSTETNSISVIYKYEDQYFIPFQSIRTNSVEWQPIQDLKGNTALIAVTSGELKGFQYDGWHFLESNMAYNENVIGSRFKNIQALHTYDFDGHQILVIACERCKFTNIYTVNFTTYNAMKDLHSDLLVWCTATLEELESSDEPYFVAESLRGDQNEQIEDEQKRQLSATLTESSEIIDNIEDSFKYALTSDKAHIFENDVEAEMLIFNNDSTVNSLHCSSFNNISIDEIFDNVLIIENGFDVDGLMKFNLVIVENNLHFKNLNDIPLERYVLLDNELTLENLTVSGFVRCKDGLNVQISINNVNVTGNLLLKDVDQIFAQNLTVAEISIDNLTTNTLNGFKVEALINSNNQIQESSHINYLKVKALEVGGFLNGVSIPVLTRRALKKFGDQKFDESLTFSSLTVDRINLKGNLSEMQFPSDFVFIHSGEYVVNQDVEFLKELKINKLEAMSHVNNISVNNNGDLDVLLTDSPYIQEISTKKTFDNLITTNPIKLRNKIKNMQLQRFSPVILDNNTYQIKDDLTVNGRVEATRWLKFKDMKPHGENKTFGDILEKGVSLSDTQIPVHFRFTQLLEVEDIIADKVNSLNPHDWILEVSNSSQVVSGQKRFMGDLHLESHVNALKINDVNVQILEKEILRIEGDQEAEGIWEVDRVVVKAGIKTNKTYFKNSSGKYESKSDFLVVGRNLTLKHLNTTNLQVKGLLNLRNVSQITMNLARKDANFKIFGKKTFNELHIEDLIIQDNNSEFVHLFHDIMSNQVNLDTNLSLFNDIGINHMKFAKHVNNVSKEHFDGIAKLKSSSNDTTIISSNVEYDEIVVTGEVFVADNFINGKNLTAIAEDTVKIDEDHAFGTVKISGAVSVHETLHLDGSIENLDLNNIVEQNSGGPVDIQDKVFMSPMFINGTLFINGTINGLDINKFCIFLHPSDLLKTLKIEGDVVFVKGPKVLSINNLSVKNLKNTLWFTDKPTNILRTLHLSNTTFNSSVHVMEFVDGINLSLLSKNYLSKTKDQIVSASLAFNNVTFSNISTPQLKSKGPINGILMDDILKTVLIQGIPQIFEIPVYFEEVEVQSVNEDSEYAVNGLNLKTEIMRYNHQNIVTGQKIFRNLNVNTLNLNHGVKIQNVDVLDWMRNAVLTNGTFRITGKQILKRGTFKQGLSLRGKLNDRDFNQGTVMLVDTQQVITGKKYFITDNEEPMKFKLLLTKRPINGINLEELVRNQTNRHQNNTLHSKIVFDNNVLVKNINVDVIYDNVNVSELIANVSKLRTLERFQNKFKNLLNMGMQIEGALKDQATSFKYYKEIMHLTNAYDVVGLNCEDEIFRVVAFYFENGTTIYRTFEWNVDARAFTFSGENIGFSSRPNYMKHVSLGGKDYLYIEHFIGDYGNQHYRPVYSGRLLQLINPTTFKPVAEFQRNATVSLIPFLNPGLNEFCLGFVDDTLSGIDIYCDETNQHSYYWAGRIPMEGLYEAAALQIQDSVYLFLARRGLNFREPSIVVLQSTAGFNDFVEIQTIYEGADLNGLTASYIGGVPYASFSFGSQQSTVESGWISIRKFDMSTNQFHHWQHIPVTAPLGVHFVTQTSFEPLLLVSSGDASAPLQTFRYDGVAGFRRILKGSSLAIGSQVRIIGNGHFLAAIQDDGNGTILGAVIKGSVGN